MLWSTCIHVYLDNVHVCTIKKEKKIKQKIKNHTVSRLHLGARKGRPEGRCCLPSVACGLRGGRTSRSIPASFIWSRSLVSLSPWSTSCSTPTTGPNDAMCVGWATGKFFFLFYCFFFVLNLNSVSTKALHHGEGLGMAALEKTGHRWDIFLSFYCFFFI